MDEIKKCIIIICNTGNGDVMRKFITVLLLYIFLCQISFAGQETPNPDVYFYRISVTDNSDVEQNIYFTKKGKVKRIVEANIIQDANIVLTPPEEKFLLPCIKNEPVSINVEKFMQDFKYKYPVHYNNNIIKKSHIKLNLANGNFVIAYKEYPTVAEYLPNGDLTGFINVSNIISDNKNLAQAFYEYRLSSDNEKIMDLKHIYFILIKKQKYINQYVFNAQGDLLCKHIGNKVYIAEGNDNLIPNWSQKTLKYHLSSMSSLKGNSKRNNKLVSTTMLVTSPIWAPLFIYCIWCRP